MKLTLLTITLIVPLYHVTVLAREACRFAQPGSRDESAIASLQDSDVPLFLMLSRAPNVDDPWLITILQITRLHNPKSKIYVFVRAEAILENRALLQWLASLHVEVRVTEAYESKHSAMARLKALLPEETGGEEYMSRYCAYADEASRAGIKRFMAIDGDMALFAPAADLAAPYTEDIVTACVFTSQFLIINNVNAIHQFCNFISNYYAQNTSTLHEMAAEVGRTPDHYLFVHDMEMLQLFLSHTPSVSRRILCPEAPGVPVCSSSYAGCLLSSQVQAIESFFKVRYNQSDTSLPWTACANISSFMGLVEWVTDSRGVPVPYHRGTGQCLPVIHFQGDCKRFIKPFSEYYKQVVHEAFAARLGRRRLRREVQTEPVPRGSDLNPGSGLDLDLDSASLKWVRMLLEGPAT